MRLALIVSVALLLSACTAVQGAKQPLTREGQIEAAAAARDAATRCGPTNTKQRSGTEGRYPSDYECVRK